MLEQCLARTRAAPGRVDEQVVEEATPVALERAGERADVRHADHVAVQLGDEALEVAELGDPVPEEIEIGRGHLVERGVAAVELGPPLPVRLRHGAYDDWHAAIVTGQVAGVDVARVDGRSARRATAPSASRTSMARTSARNGAALNRHFITTSATASSDPAVTSPAVVS